MNKELLIWIGFCVIYSFIVAGVFNLQFGFNFHSVIGAIISMILISRIKFN